MPRKSPPPPKPRATATATARPKATPAADRAGAATVARLRDRLREAEDTLEAIRQGHVDALVVQGPDGDQVFTLRGADHRYRQLVETMTEGALLLAADATLVYANAAFADLVKRPLETLIGTRLHAVVPPALHALVDAVLTGRGGAPGKAEIEIRAADGTRVPVYLSATASWDDAGQLTCVIATDLSEQRRSRDALAAERLAALIVDQAVEGIVVCDPSGRVIRASQAALRLAGDNPLLRYFEEAFPLRVADDPATAQTLIWSALRGETTNGVPVSVVRDGERAELLLSVGPITDRSGEPLGCVVSFADVTEQRRSAEERAVLLEETEAARLEAEAANRAKDEFLAMLGHELRNPLAPILTALETMRVKDGIALRREREVIERQVKHMVRLVDDLLDLSRIAEGHLHLDRHHVELAAIVAHALEVAAPLVDERRHALAVAVPGDLWVHGDEQRLGQVVANLLTNAAKYTPPGGHLEVRAALEGDVVVIAIADDGIGIPDELLPRVFDRFVQGRRTLDRGDGGLGIGLAIVKTLVGLHGGTVTVHSDGRDRGSTFEVRLPAVAAPDDTRVRPPATRTGPAPRRILVVDDNVDAANLLGEALDASGHETRVAYDGPTALTLAATFAPDVAILDIGLPGMDGYEVARRLRASLPHPLSIVAVTGYAQDSDRRRSAAAGFDLHLVKPIKLRDLDALIAATARD